jgi:glycosidase
MGMAWLLTTRGIPQIYYGTEVMMKGDKGINDGWVRLDFPGGWEGDTKNAFTGNGLTNDEKEFQIYTKKIANFRKKSSAIGNGKLMQFVPEDGVYVYFRYDDKQTVMCIMNTNESEKEVTIERFSERITGFKNGKDVVSGDVHSIQKSVKVPAKQLMILELSK